MTPKTCLPTLLLCLLLSNINAQKDTTFWFVAPEITQGLYDYDRPVAFWVSTYEFPATVTLQQPANGSFLPQVIVLPANTSGRFVFPPFHDLVENKPPNTILNKGFLIKSTAHITAYYEVIGEYKSNPELFSLKGRNALGTNFYIPMQNIMPNSGAYSPLPHSAFDIVATENGTSVSITPSASIVGHTAGIPFTIMLNRGQTYSAEAASQSAAGHPAGSRVAANKPIAITIKDDLLESGLEYGGGSCRDMVGDQIVPVSRLGTRYIVQKGLLYTSEDVFIMGTEPNTQVKIDGAFYATINGGVTVNFQVNGIHFIEASAPVYVFQVTGNGCEVGGEIMPPVDCSGSRSVRFVRPTDEPLLLFLSIRTGQEGGFLLNGMPLPANIFMSVPGSNGEFVATTMLASESQVPEGFSSIIENSLGLFQMGFLNGQESATGCRYGYFSDFGNETIIRDSVSFCAGKSILSHGLLIEEPGDYEIAVSNAEGCDTLYQIAARQQELIFEQQAVYFCPGTSVIINGVSYSMPQEIIDTLGSVLFCDTIRIYSLQFSNLIPAQQTRNLCPGSSINIHGTIYTQPGTFQDTILSSSGCDTLLTSTIEWSEIPEIQREIVLCKAQSVNIGGIDYSQPGTVVDTILSETVGCDTLRFNILRTDDPLPFLPEDTVICSGSAISLSSSYPNTYWNGVGPSETYTVYSPGLVIAVTSSNEGCPRIDSIFIKTCCSDDNVFLPNIFSPNNDGLNDEFCIYTIEQCKQFILRIYDRWGALIFESRNPQTCWDGSFQGRAKSAGVYVWVVEFYSDKSFSKEILKGDVTLLR